MGAAINPRTTSVAAAFDRTAYLPVASVTVPAIDTPLFDSAYCAAGTRSIARALISTREARSEAILA